VPRTIKGKYKRGVFEPLEPVVLPEDYVVEINVPDSATDEDDRAFLSSAGGWKDLVPEQFIEETYSRRLRGNRPPVEL
jgi:predicted DNA-binding antitoxin AbrB/MazE fold protein